MSTSYQDRLRSLQYESEQRERKALLDSPHMQPLTALVDQIRKEKHLGTEVPYFDPCDGGINARVLFLLEAAGPKAVKTTFISRNNNDETAEKMFSLLKKAGLKRQDTLLWNIVPWYLGTGKKILPAKPEDLKAGNVYLRKLLPLLKELRAIVLVGKKARGGFAQYDEKINARIFYTPHPSPSNLKSRPELEGEILARFTEVATFINS